MDKILIIHFTWPYFQVEQRVTHAFKPSWKSVGGMKPGPSHHIPENSNDPCHSILPGYSYTRARSVLAMPFMKSVNWPIFFALVMAFCAKFVLGSNLSDKKSYDEKLQDTWSIACLRQTCCCLLSLFSQ